MIEIGWPHFTLTSSNRYVVASFLSVILTSLIWRMTSPASKPAAGSGRPRPDDVDRHFRVFDQAFIGQLQAVHVDGRGGVSRTVFTFDRWRRLLGSLQLECHLVSRFVAWLARRTGRGLVDALVAGRAAIEAGHVAEVVVERQLRQPDLLDLQRTAEGVDDRQLKNTLAEVRSAVFFGLDQTLQVGVVVIQRLLSGRYGALRSRLESLATPGGASWRLDTTVSGH